MEQVKPVEISVLTRNSGLEQRIRRGISLWAEERCVCVDLSRRETAAFRCAEQEAVTEGGAVEGRGERTLLTADIESGGSRAGERTLLIADFESAETPDRCAVAICAGEQEAIRAYRSHPAACIPPDFTYPLLCGAMDRCRDLWRSGLRRLSNPPLPMGQIQYAEARGKETDLHTPTGAETVKLLLGRVADLLPGPPFFRCHSGFLVSLPAVSEVGAGEAVMTDGRRIPVSRRYAGELRAAWKAWRRDREAL